MANLVTEVEYVRAADCAMAMLFHKQLHLPESIGLQKELPN